MKLYLSSILILSCVFSFGWCPKGAIASDALLSTNNSIPTALTPNTKSTEVQVLQVQLKALGYYNNVIDGHYGINTQNGVIQFQKAQGLKRIDGVADSTTRIAINKVLAGQNKSTSAPTPIPASKAPPQASKMNYIWWSLIGVGGLGSIAALLYWQNRLKQTQTIQQEEISTPKLLSAAKTDSLELSQQSPDPEPVTLSAKLLPPAKTTVLNKLDPVEELIKDLRSSDPIKRKKAIWTLGQQGDSRAIQPLLDLMIDADSQQHGLILSALTEIELRIIKPMNRALAVSIQHDSPQVRQNAIRDLARIYDMMGQMSQILRHAMEDTDGDVQTTAKYALNHLNRMRIFSEQQPLPEHSPETVDF